MLRADVMRGLLWLQSKPFHNVWGILVQNAWDSASRMELFPTVLNFGEVFGLRKQTSACLPVILKSPAVCMLKEKRSVDNGRIVWQPFRFVILWNQIFWEVPKLPAIPIISMTQIGDLPWCAQTVRAIQSNNHTHRSWHVDRTTFAVQYRHFLLIPN